MWNKVESSNVDALNFSGTSLQVKFKNGSVYQYENVTEEMFRTILQAASVGRTFNELIKSNPVDYPFSRVS